MTGTGMTQPTRRLRSDTGGMDEARITGAWGVHIIFSSKPREASLQCPPVVSLSLPDLSV